VTKAGREGGRQIIEHRKQCMTSCKGKYENTIISVHNTESENLCMIGGFTITVTIKNCTPRLCDI
jgi:hypothetical protein